MDSPIVSIAILLGSMQLTKRLDLQNTRTQKRVLFGFLTAQAIVLAIHHLVRRRILQRKDMTLLKYLDQPPPSILPPAPTSNQKTTSRLVRTTHMDYDLEQVRQAQRQTLTNLAMMTFLYYQFGVVRPLIVQSLLPVRNVLAAKLAQVHLFGAKAEGALSRPWRAESPLAALLGGGKGQRGSR
ncbi:hypothetical protein BGZ93_003091 [Podila epicladia]|nr:hypothetical protein BGZ92_004509 [Podila epicladia]KAG0097277.1 hypothetical protein BGZ93_003091 [Podila epicladia]